MVLEKEKGKAQKKKKVWGFFLPMNTFVESITFYITAVFDVTACGDAADTQKAAFLQNPSKLERCFVANQMFFPHCCIYELEMVRETREKMRQVTKYHKKSKTDNVSQSLTFLLLFLPSCSKLRRTFSIVFEQECTEEEDLSGSECRQYF